MSSKSFLGLSPLLGVCLLAACATSPEQEAARAEAQALIDAEITARQGEAVTRVCPRGSDSWKALGDDVILLEAHGKWYMAELSGTCNPDSARAALVTRGASASSCLSRGDDIFTGRPRSGERCVITALYEWNEEAKASISEAATPVEN
jgi:hypothetical protein